MPSDPFPCLLPSSFHLSSYMRILCWQWPQWGQEVKDHFFSMWTALQLPSASNTHAALCREEFALNLLERKLQKPLSEMTALDKMKGGVLLRSSLKTIWSSISIHWGDAAWNKYKPMNKSKTGIDTQHRWRVGGGCQEMARLWRPLCLVARCDPF